MRTLRLLSHAPGQKLLDQAGNRMKAWIEDGAAFEACFVKWKKPLKGSGWDSKKVCSFRAMLCLLLLYCRSPKYNMCLCP